MRLFCGGCADGFQEEVKSWALTRSPRVVLSIPPVPSFSWRSACYCVIAAFCMLAASHEAEAAEAVLAWDAVADTRVQMYEVHYGLDSGHYDGKVTTSTTSATIPGLTPGATYYFVVRACDADGTLCSAFSEEIERAHPRVRADSEFHAKCDFGRRPTWRRAHGSLDWRHRKLAMGVRRRRDEHRPVPEPHLHDGRHLYREPTVSGPGGSDTKTFDIDVSGQPPAGEL